MRKLEIKYTFFRWFRDVNKFEELEMDTGSLYLAFADKQLCDWTFQASAQYGLKSETSTVETLEKIQKQLITPYLLFQAKTNDKREPGLFKWSSDALKSCAFAVIFVVVLKI